MGGRFCSNALPRVYIELLLLCAPLRVAKLHNSMQRRHCVVWEQKKVSSYNNIKIEHHRRHANQGLLFLHMRRYKSFVRAQAEERRRAESTTEKRYYFLDRGPRWPARSQ